MIGPVIVLVIQFYLPKCKYKLYIRKFIEILNLNILIDKP